MGIRRLNGITAALTLAVGTVGMAFAREDGTPFRKAASPPTPVSRRHFQVKFPVPATRERSHHVTVLVNDVKGERKILDRKYAGASPGDQIARTSFVAYGGPDPDPGLRQRSSGVRAEKVTGNEAQRERAQWVCEQLDEEYGRLTWRSHGEPLGALVMTILSQHTSDRNSERAYDSLRRRSPTGTPSAPRRWVRSQTPSGRAAWPTPRHPASGPSWSRYARRRARRAWIFSLQCRRRRQRRILKRSTASGRRRQPAC